MVVSYFLLLLTVCLLWPVHYHQTIHYTGMCTTGSTWPAENIDRLHLHLVHHLGIRLQLEMHSFLLNSCVIFFTVTMGCVQARIE